MGKQTHVVRAQFEEIHEKLGAYEERQKQLKFQLAKIQRGVYQVSFSLYRLNYIQVLTSMLHALEAGLDEHLRAKNKLRVWLDIPLLDKADYTLYQLHPVPVTQ